MRIEVRKTDQTGGGVDHFTTDPEQQGTLMTGYDTTSYGIRINLPHRDERTYPWSSISFVDKFYAA